MVGKKRNLTSDGGAVDLSLGAEDLTSKQVEEIKSAYEEALGRNKALLDEVEFVLAQRLQQSGIKVHLIEKRVKTLKSVLDKCRRKRVPTFSSLRDVVGARIVCLFRSDMVRVGKVVEDNFEIIEKDDKLAQLETPLGYFSVHYACRMPARYQGPRYESAADLVFEIQVRTLCMHAWAAVSHHLDYKGEWDVPVELKTALGALSGLFYVADNQFEQFYAAREESRKNAEKSSGSADLQDINLDTLSAFLTSQFPKRRAPKETVSELVQDIKRAGYVSMSQVRRDVERAGSAFLGYEQQYPPGKKGRKFSAVGAVRLSLVLASNAFRKTYEDDEFGPLDAKHFRDPLLDYCLAD